jgi:hypothetical protein
MNPRLSSYVLVALSICYGVAIGILGALESSALLTVTVIGAIVLGGLWAIRGLLISRSRST